MITLNVEKVTNTLAQAGLCYSLREANTGTNYIKIPSFDVIVRVADHSDAYCTSDISISPLDDNYTDFLEFMVRKIADYNDDGMYQNELDIFTKRYNASKSARERAVNAKIKARDELIQKGKIEKQRLEDQAKWIEENYPDYSTLSKRQKKSIRQKYNKSMR
jgi:hypothetical protein